MTNAIQCRKALLILLDCHVGWLHEGHSSAPHVRPCTLPPPCNLPNNVATVPPGGGGIAPQNCTIVSQCESASAPCKNFLCRLQRLVFSMLFGPSDRSPPVGGDYKGGIRYAYAAMFGGSFASCALICTDWSAGQGFAHFGSPLIPVACSPCSASLWASFCRPVHLVHMERGLSHHRSPHSPCSRWHSLGQASWCQLCCPISAASGVLWCGVCPNTCGMCVVPVAVPCGAVLDLLVRH